MFGIGCLFFIRRWMFDVRRSSFKTTLYDINVICECLQNNLALMVQKGVSVHLFDRVQRIESSMRLREALEPIICPEEASMAFRAPIKVCFSDIDYAGIMYHPRFLHYFHVALEELFVAFYGFSPLAFVANDRNRLSSFSLPKTA